MKSASDTHGHATDIGRQAARVYAGTYWFPLNAAEKALVAMLEEQGFLEPRKDSAQVGQAIEPKHEASTQMDLLPVSA